MADTAGNALAALVAAAIEIGPEVAVGATVVGMLGLLFRVVFLSMTRNDTEMVRLLAQLREERDRAQRWQAWQAARADHWQARFYGEPNPPPIPPQPTDTPPPAPPPAAPSL